MRSAPHKNLTIADKRSEETKADFMSILKTDPALADDYAFIPVDLVGQRLADEARTQAFG
jgi:hypothetical protein